MGQSILPIIIAVLSGNLLTAMFIYGVRASMKIYSYEDASFSVLACIIIPMLFLALGAYAYI